MFIFSVHNIQQSGIDNHQFLSVLHQRLQNRLDTRLPWRVATIGARMAPRKPPFCIICRFFLSEVFFIDRRLRFCLLRQSAFFCLADNSILLRRIFLAHLVIQSRNSLLQRFAYWLFSLFPYLLIWLSNIKNFLIQFLKLRFQFDVNVDRSRFRSTSYDVITANRRHDYSDCQQDELKHQIYNRRWYVNNDDNDADDE